MTIPRCAFCGREVGGPAHHFVVIYRSRDGAALCSQACQTKLCARDTNGLHQTDPAHPDDCALCGRRAFPRERLHRALVDEAEGGDIVCGFLAGALLRALRASAPGWPP